MWRVKSRGAADQFGLKEVNVVCPRSNERGECVTVHDCGCLCILKDMATDIVDAVGVERTDSYTLRFFGILKQKGTKGSDDG